ncbi:MAG: DUF3786 domain-containing protein [Nitrospirota bacterium]
MTKIVPGENNAWERLACADPEEICRKAEAAFDYNSRIYRVKSFGRVFSVDVDKKEILSADKEGEIFLDRLSYFFRLSVLWYLLKATDARPSGKLVKPASMSGGDIFFRGTHVLPLDAVAKKYAGDREGFISKGIAMGGKEVEYGDAALELYPFPKIPVTLILWVEDEEWPARADLLFDSTVYLHLPVDILWSVAMMTALVFL